jgi:hypothetical protein
MGPLYFCIALGPLAVYLLLIGIINLLRRPFITTGSRDTIALSIALFGFVLIGPMRLFVPESAVIHFGVYVWVLLAGLYTLSITLLILLMRPKLIIYNTTVRQIRTILADLVTEMDETARWAGNTVALPQRGIQLTIETFPGTRNIQLVAAGHDQNYLGWRELGFALTKTLDQTRVTKNPYGILLVLASSLLLLSVGFQTIKNRAEIAHQWSQIQQQTNMEAEEE